MDPAPDPEPRALRLVDLTDALLADVARRQAARAAGIPFGPVSGYQRLDHLLSGCFEPGLHILHGSPGVGKTAFALGLALECRCPCVFVTCEVSPLELLRRAVSRVTALYLGKMKSGTADLSIDALTANLSDVRGASADLLILDGTAAPVPVNVIERAAQIARADPAGHLLVVVDSAHQWAEGLPSAGGKGEEYDRLNEALADLKALAAALSCPVLTIAERNRASAKTGGQGASAGTRRFEYVAETVLELDAERDAKGDPLSADPDGWSGVRLTVSKNRHGSTGTVPLLWHGAMQRHRQEGA